MTANFSITPNAFLNWTLTVSIAQELVLSTKIFPKHQRHSNVSEIIPVKITLATLLAIGFAPGVFGNILVLIAILPERALRKQKGNLMLINRAITDLLMATLPTPVIGIYFTFYWPEWVFGEALCRTTVFFTGISGFVSVLTMFFITIYRYFAIVRNKSMLKRHNVKIILCLLWVISTVALTRKLTHRGITNHNFKNNCSDFRVCCKMKIKKYFLTNHKNIQL